MRITVLIPSWNAEAYILRAVRSILDNGYEDVEVRIMDNLSTDKTREIIENLNDKRISFTSAKDGGLYDALNKGMAKATGEVVSWIGADDQLAPGALQAVATTFQDASVQWAAGDGIFLFEGEATARQMNHRIPSRVDLRRLMAGNALISPSVFFRRSFFKATGGFNTLYSLAADYDLWLRFANQQAPAVIRQPLSVFSYNGGNASSKSKIKMYKETLRIVAQTDAPGLWWAKLSNRLRLNAYIAYNRLRNGIR